MNKAMTMALNEQQGRAEACALNETLRAIGVVGVLCVCSAFMFVLSMRHGFEADH
jgi:hypothetical protein